MNLLDYAIQRKLSGGSGGGGGSDEEWFNDGDTHIWITLPEGRTSPMLGVCPKGTVTVDWGDGSTPDTLTGTSVTIVQFTPRHNYASAGDYVIRLTVDGQMGFYGNMTSENYSYVLRHSSSKDALNKCYQSCVKKVEMGRFVSLENCAFYNCYSLDSVVIPDGVTRIGEQAFRECSLGSVVIPDGVTEIDENAFHSCYSLDSLVIPDSVTTIGQYAFNNCYSLKTVVIPDGVTTIGQQTFANCKSLDSLVIPDSVTTIGKYAIQQCRTLKSLAIPFGVTTIDNYTFSGCTCVAFYDFTRHTTVPTLSATNAFTDIPADCEIRVPAALYDEWIAATNWSTYASQIVAV